MAFVRADEHESECKNSASAPVAVIASNVATSLTFYPLVYARSLMQVGYEPVLPVEGRTLSGSKAYFFPNVIGYVKHMSKENGFKSLWTGYSYRLSAILISSQLEPRVSAFLEERNCSQSPNDAPVIQACKKCTNDVVTKVTITVVLYPLQVMMYRAIVSTIGGETIYKAPLKAISHILNTEGLPGFYSGLLPTVFAEAMGITIVHGLNYLFNRYVMSRFGLDESMTAGLRLLFAMFVGRLSYPFHVVSTNMAITRSGLKASRLLTARPYQDSFDCFAYLRSKHNLRLGEDFFWRRYLGNSNSVIASSRFVVNPNLQAMK